MKTRKKNRLKNLLKFGVFLFGISLLLWNCEEETLEEVDQQEVKQNGNLDFKLESLTFNQIENETIFSKLKTTFNIEDPVYHTKKRKYFSKIKKTHSKSSTQDFSDLSSLIDVNTIKKITSENYVSYTMRLVEPQNTTNSFFNIVVQENNGIQEVFTVKYTPTETLSKTTSSADTFEGTFTVARGIIPYDGWDNSSDNDTGGSADDFEETCIEVAVVVPVPCTGTGHNVGQSCKCGTTDSNGHYYNCQKAYNDVRMETQCTTWNFLVDTSNNNTNTGYNGDNTSGNGGNGGNGSPSGGDGNIITTPVTDILPQGALESIVECVALNKTQVDWLNIELSHNPSNVTNIWKYINENNCDNDTQNVITESIDEDLLSNESFEEIFKRKKECKKIKKLFDNNATLKDELITLKGFTGASTERGKFKLNSTSLIQNTPVGTDGMVEVTIPAGNQKYEMIAHTHNSPRNATYSVFSFGDLEGINTLLRKGKIDNTKFVFFLMTADGTNYAITINNPTQFKKVFATILDSDFNLETAENRVKQRRIYYKGDTDTNTLPLIQENSADNLTDEKLFLDFLENVNIGLTLFEVSDNFRSFESVTHNKDTGNINKQNCN